MGSDHTLVIGTIALKLRRAKLTEKRQPRFDVSKFRDSETCGKSQVEIRNRFSVLEDEQELDIVAFNKVLMAASDKVLGYKKNKKEEWITGDTWKKIDERKETKKKLNQAKSQRLKDRLQTTYSEQDKEVKRMTRKDKKEFVDKLADEAENAAERRDLRSLYKITKTLTGGFHNNDRPVKDINDKVVTSEREQVERWAEYFRAVLNRQDPDTIAKNTGSIRRYRCQSGSPNTGRN